MAEASKVVPLEAMVRRIYDPFMLQGLRGAGMLSLFE